MRTKISKRLIRALSKRPSNIIKRLQLQVLLLYTARAFKRKSRLILFNKEPLRDYMNYTRDCMKTEVNLNRLYRVAYRLGRNIKNLLGLSKPEDLKELVYLLYQNIGIRMTGALPEEFLVCRCFFSRFYSPGECRIMSAMDSGIIAGVYSGVAPYGRLEFTSRLTQNCANCRAYLTGGLINE